jgi:hypothetical protein
MSAAKQPTNSVRSSLYKNLAGIEIDSNISEKQSNTINMDKNENNTIKDNQVVRINIGILKKNYTILKDYKAKYGVQPASKASELLNRAIQELEKEL